MAEMPTFCFANKHEAFLFMVDASDEFARKLLEIVDNQKVQHKAIESLTEMMATLMTQIAMKKKLDKGKKKKMLDKYLNR